MGPSASATSWLSEDDLLLKNSVEKGASLQSLAKGAVQFSRRFTVQELRDRWYSLLFDTEISAKASANMIEQDGISSRLTRLGGSKEKHGALAKRKFESIRSCYYAMRKKTRNQPFNSLDLSFILTPSNGDDSLVCDSMLGDPMSDQLRPQDSNLGIMHQDFVSPLMDCVSAIDRGDTGNNFFNGLHDSVREYFPIHIDEMQNDISGIVGENFSFTGNGSEIEEHSQPKDLPASNIVKTDDFQANPPSTIGEICSDPGKLCLEYEKNQVFNSSVSNCGASFYNLEHSSTEKPIWETVDEFSAQAFPFDVSIKSNDLHAGDRRENGDSNIKHSSASEYNNDLVSKVQNEATGDADASTQHYLAELSVSLLNFTDEEEFLCMDVDGEEVIDKSYYDGLSSLLLSSPNDDNNKPLPSELANSVVSNPHCTETSDACDGGFTNMVSNIRIEVELHDSFIVCTLNTEDSEIPCNDHIFLPGQVPASSSYSVAQDTSLEPNSLKFPSAFIPGNQKIAERGPTCMQKDQSNQKPFPVSSQMVGQNITPEPAVGQYHQEGDHALKNVLCSGDRSSFLLKESRNACTALGVSSQLGPTNYGVDNSLVGKPKEEAEVMAERKQISHELPAVGIPSHDPVVCRSSQCGTNQELGTSSGPAVDHPTSDAEEQAIESDDDLPYFSDIEAMILDMDLAPYDQDLSQTAEVLKYQQEDTIRTIIRLEQGANVCMQRSIASHGAFAVLYGRHSKHYIRKPEVMLGRSTEDVNVDIDLGREGCANKISRQQATIRMGGDGSFYLNNLGKCLVSVNGNEVAPGQGLKLYSGCLIEIRGIPFIFETNHTRVKQYLYSVSNEMQA